MKKRGIKVSFGLFLILGILLAFAEKFIVFFLVTRELITSNVILTVFPFAVIGELIINRINLPISFLEKNNLEK